MHERVESACPLQLPQRTDTRRLRYEGIDQIQEKLLGLLVDKLGAEPIFISNLADAWIFSWHERLVI
jgi:hypothetical protein